MGNYYNLQECEEGHMSVGRGNTCSICGKSIINNYTRVVGFLTNTKNWHKVRREIDYPYRQFIRWNIMKIVSTQYSLINKAFWNISFQLRRGL